MGVFIVDCFFFLRVQLPLSQWKHSLQKCLPYKPERNVPHSRERNVPTQLVLRGKWETSVLTGTSGALCGCEAVQAAYYDFDLDPRNLLQRKHVLCTLSLQIFASLQRIKELPFIKAYLVPQTTCACVLSHFSHFPLFVTLWTIAHQVPLSMGFFRKDTGVGCHFLLQGVFQTQGSNPLLMWLLHWQTGFLPLAPPGKPTTPYYILNYILVYWLLQGKYYYLFLTEKLKIDGIKELAQTWDIQTCFVQFQEFTFFFPLRELII